MSTSTPERALVVYESMFGNTRLVAGAIAAGLRSSGMEAEVVDVCDSPPGEVQDADLLVLGAPTHAFSLSRPNTRADAVRQGAPERQATTGMREWLAATSDAGRRPPVAVFDSRVTKVRRLPAAAGRKAAKLARAHGFDLVAPAEAFLVEDVQGPLVDGELARAEEWGRDLARRCRAARATAASPR